MLRLPRLTRRQAVVFSRDDAARLNRRFAGLDRRTRRAILRAVNRGEVMPDRGLAELAIGVARRQQRFWRRAWLLGPAMALVQALLTPLSLREGLLLALWGTLLLGGLAFWWWSRAVRAEERNLALVRRTRRDPWDGRGQGAGRAGRGGPDARPGGMSRGPRNRLPGGPPVPEQVAEDDGGHASDGQDGPPRGPAGLGGPRPPRPRGRKRR